MTNLYELDEVKNSPRLQGLSLQLWEDIACLIQTVDELTVYSSKNNCSATSETKNMWDHLDKLSETFLKMFPLEMSGNTSEPFIKARLGNVFHLRSLTGRVKKKSQSLSETMKEADLENRPALLRPQV